MRIFYRYVETNWYTITSFRQLALNSSISVEKGQRVLVTGKLRIREWDNGERVGTTIDIEAESIGHDLAWGTAKFTRSIMSSPSVPVESSPLESSPLESSPPDSASIDSALREHEAAAGESLESEPEMEGEPALEDDSEHDIEAEARLAVEPAVPF